MLFDESELDSCLSLRIDRLELRSYIWFVIKLKMFSYLIFLHSVQPLDLLTVRTHSRFEMCWVNAPPYYCGYLQIKLFIWHCINFMGQRHCWAGIMSIITLQCGNYANYVGAHFWNLQVRKEF